ATLIAALCILRLRPETSLGGLLDESDAAVVAMERVLDQFPVVNELLVLATLPDGAADDPAPLLAFAERLQAAAASDADARAIVTHVRFRAESQTRTFVEREIVPNGLYYLSDRQLDELMQRLTKPGMQAQLERNEQMLSLPGPAAGGLAKAFAKDPLRLQEFLLERVGEISVPGGSGGGGGGPFLSPDRRSLLIRIGGARSPSDFRFAQRMTDAVERLAGEANHERLRIDIAGAYAMSAHSARKIQADSISDIVSTVLGLVVLFTIACRRPARLFAFAFIPVAIGVAWGFAAYALLRHTITPLAAVVGGTLGAIGLDYTIHFITHFQEARRTAADTAAAVVETSREMFWPSLAAWMTSVIGFAAVAISPVRVLRDFAVLGTLCLVGAWVATLLVLPAMLARFSRGDASPFEGRFQIADAIGRWISSHAKGLLVGSGLVLALLVGALLVRGVRYELSSDPMVMHPQPSPPLEAQRFIAQRMQVAAGALIVHLEAESPLKLLTMAHAVQHRLRDDAVRAAGVSGVFGLASLLPDPVESARRRAGLDPALPDRVAGALREALADSAFRPEAFDNYATFLKTLMSPGDPPDVQTLTTYPQLAQLLLPRAALDGSAAPTQAVTLIFSREPLETRANREAALSAVRHALHGVDGVTVTGTAVIGHDLDRSVHRDLPRFVIVALVCIGGYLLVHFRSAKLAAMALLPIAISLLCVVAFISLADVRLNLIHTVAAPLLLGINLDYGIFAVHAWRTSRNAGDLSHHFPASLSALLTCGGATLIGFGSLVITSIPAVRTLGWIVNVGVGTCVLSTLLVLWPAMMLALRRWRGGSDDSDDILQKPRP
ncbi:MAG: MMPL family transporter, partial [Tepidisphaeraceae bacterium]